MHGGPGRQGQEGQASALEGLAIQGQVGGGQAGQGEQTEAEEGQHTQGDTASCRLGLEGSGDAWLVVFLFRDPKRRAKEKSIRLSQCPGCGLGEGEN